MVELKIDGETKIKIFGNKALIPENCQDRLDVVLAMLDAISFCVSSNVDDKDNIISINQ